MRSVIRIGSLTLFLILTLSAHPILAAQSTIEAVLYEDTAVHHLGDQVLGDWEIPEPEGIAYEATFSLDTSSNIILALDVFNVHQDTPIKLNNAQIDFLCAQGGYDEWNSCHYNIDSSFTMEGENYLTIELQYFEGLDDHYDDIMIRNVRLFLCPGTAEFFDADGDGWAGCDGHVDCDDSDSDINPEMGVYPGAPELCDGLDTDCDGILPDDEFDDADGDGYMICEGDCDDTDPDVSPDAVEGAIEDPSCSDGIDNDCDGLIDTDPECISFLVPDEQSTIQDAINAAESGNTILVDPGIYRENIDFMGKSITVHSVDGPVTTIIDGDRSGSVVTFSSGETEDAVLGGFTIKNGSGTYNVLVPHLGFGRYVGGGLYLENSSPTITNCMITNNYAFIGGGLYLRASTPMITNSMIVRNRATGFIHGGGGIFLEDSNPTVTHCTVGSNSAVQYGGAIYCYDASPRITNSILFCNIWLRNPCEIRISRGDLLGCGRGLVGRGKYRGGSLLRRCSNFSPHAWFPLLRQRHGRRGLHGHGRPAETVGSRIRHGSR